MRHLAVRSLVFAVLVGTFWAMHGFERPEIAPDDYRSSARVASASMWTVVLFLVGASLATFSDVVGRMFDTELPDAALRVIGVILLIAGALWMTAIWST